MTSQELFPQMMKLHFIAYRVCKNIRKNIDRSFSLDNTKAISSQSAQLVACVEPIYKLYKRACPSRYKLVSINEQK